MTVRWEEHLAQMRQIKTEIKTTTGRRHDCLVRQYNRMAKELKTAQAYLKQREEATACQKG